MHGFPDSGSIPSRGAAGPGPRRPKPVLLLEPAPPLGLELLLGQGQGPTRPRRPPRSLSWQDLEDS